MTQAIFIIALVGFVGRIVISAIALRNWGVFAVLAIFAASICGLALFGGLTALTAFQWLGNAIGSAVALPFCLLMLAIGYAVPTLLRVAERRSRAWQVSSLFLALVATAVTIDVWRTVGGESFLWFFLTPDNCFVTGMVFFLVFQARFFEDDGGDVEPVQRRRM